MVEVADLADLELRAPRALHASTTLDWQLNTRHTRPSPSSFHTLLLNHHHLTKRPSSSTMPAQKAAGRRRQAAASPRALAPRVTIDHTAFPHIMDMIISYTTHRAWLLLRQTSRAFRDRMEARMCYHVQITEDHAVKKSQRKHMRIPCLRLEPPFLERTVNLLSQYLRVLDDNADMVGDRTEPDSFTDYIPPFDPAVAFCRLRLVRRDVGRLKIHVPKCVWWGRLPAAFAPDHDRTHDWFNFLSTGTLSLESSFASRAQVFHYDYDKRSVVFPPEDLVIIPGWDDAETFVFIFTEHRRKRFAFGTDDSSRDRHDELVEADMKKYAQLAGAQCGRLPGDVELDQIASIIGVPDALRMPEPVKLIIVGLEELIDTAALRLDDSEEEMNASPHELLYSYLEAHCEVEVGLTSSEAATFLERITFMSHEDYAAHVGYEQYRLETSRIARAEPSAHLFPSQ